MANEDLAAFAGQVRTALENAGYDVAEGAPHLWGIGGCEQVIPAFGNCFGNNPAAPYIIPIVPHQPGEAYAYGPSMEWGTNADGDPLFATFRLREDEAILTFGFMPPPAAYLGYQTFLFTRNFDVDNISGSEMSWLEDAIGLQRQLSPNKDTILYQKAPKYEGTEDGVDIYSQDQNRVLPFANMGPTVNNKILEEQLGEACWEQQAILSTSSDAGFAAKLNAALADIDSELAGRHVSYALGEDLKMGLGEPDDDFWTVMRYAVPMTTAGNDWRSSLADQLVVFRATPRAPSTVVRYETPTFPVKTFHTDERALAADLQKIAGEVQAKLGFGGTPQEVLLPTSQIPLFGPVAVSRALNNLGATYDTDTYRASSARDFENGAALAIVGVNHVRTENASYVSIGVYNSEELTGLYSISQGIGIDGPLNDSVQTFFTKIGGVPEALSGIDLSTFYLHILARPDVALPPGLEDTELVTVIQTSKDGSGDPVIPLEMPIRISQRAYLNPHTTCGADPKRTLSPILLANH